VQIIGDREEGAVGSYGIAGQSETCDQPGCQPQGFGDLRPVRFELLHIVAIKVLNFESHACDVGEHQSGLEDKVLGEIESESCDIQGIDEGVDLTACITLFPLRGGD
jgi:hypothetical protein